MGASNQALSLVLPKKLQGLFQSIHKLSDQTAETTHEISSTEQTFVPHSIASKLF